MSMKDTSTHKSSIDNEVMFCILASLARGATISVTLGIDFNDTTQPANFNLW